MKKDEKWVINYQSFDDLSDLDPDDALLMSAARSMVVAAYAPYSRFFVAASVRLNSGLVVSATNQENASYGLSLCAEQNVLAGVGSTHPDHWVTAMAITVSYEQKEVNYPISPCGACRQVIREHEVRHGQPMRLILRGTSGKILIFDGIQSLLPLAFSPNDLLIS